MSCRGGVGWVGHARVGVGVGHVGVGWGGPCRGGVGWGVSCRAGVGMGMSHVGFLRPSQVT